MKRYQHKNNYGIVRSLWIEWHRNQIEGFTNIPLLNYPSQSTEMRAYAGTVGSKGGSRKTPNYFPSEPKSRKFEQGFRDLKKIRADIFYHAHVLEFRNCEIVKKFGIDEDKVRYDLKKADEQLKKHMGNITFGQNKENLVDENLEKFPNLSNN